MLCTCVRRVASVHPAIYMYIWMTSYVHSASHPFVVRVIGSSINSAYDNFAVGLCEDRARTVIKLNVLIIIILRMNWIGWSLTAWSRCRSVALSRDCTGTVLSILLVNVVMVPTKEFDLIRWSASSVPVRQCFGASPGPIHSLWIVKFENYNLYIRLRLFLCNNMPWFSRQTK